MASVADDLRSFAFYPVALDVVAECQLCGREFVVSDLADEECCRALEALKEWATGEWHQP